MASSAGIVDRLRRPEYTGENRCTPCTVVNGAIALVGAGALAAVSVPLGIATLAVAGLAIYLRGYLVPYTPTLTKRYFPERVLAAFDKADTGGPTDSGRRSGPSGPADADGTADDRESSAGDGTEWETLQRLEDHRENAVDVDGFLRAEGIGEPTGGRTEPTPAFADRLAETVREAGNGTGGIDRGAVAAFLDTEPADVELRSDETPVEVKVGYRVRTWPSRAALLADLATHRALAGWTDRWGTVPVEQRLEIAEGLRSGYQRCPACGGRIEETEGTVESCCRVIDVIALVCADCGGHLREFDPGNVETRLER
jgi:hypothetical protein